MSGMNQCVVIPLNDLQNGLLGHNANGRSTASAAVVVQLVPLNNLSNNGSGVATHHSNATNGVLAIGGVTVAPVATATNHPTPTHLQHPHQQQQLQQQRLTTSNTNGYCAAGLTCTNACGARSNAVMACQCHPPPPHQCSMHPCQSSHQPRPQQLYQPRPQQLFQSHPTMLSGVGVGAVPLSRGGALLSGHQSYLSGNGNAIHTNTAATPVFTWGGRPSVTPPQPPPALNVTAPAGIVNHSNGGGLGCALRIGIGGSGAGVAMPFGGSCTNHISCGANNALHSLATTAAPPPPVNVTTPYFVGTNIGAATIDVRAPPAANNFNTAPLRGNGMVFANPIQHRSMIAPNQGANVGLQPLLSQIKLENQAMSRLHPSPANSPGSSSGGTTASFTSSGSLPSPVALAPVGNHHQLCHIGTVSTSDVSSADMNIPELGSRPILPQLSASDSSSSSSSSGVNRFLCDRCGRSYKNKRDLRNHRKIHDSTTPGCPICGKKFGRRSYLEDHIRTHTGEKPFLCEQCGRRFAAIRNLHQHKLVHLPVKPHLCNICGRRFRLKRQLRNHHCICSQ